MYGRFAGPKLKSGRNMEVTVLPKWPEDWVPLYSKNCKTVLIGHSLLLPLLSLFMKQHLIVRHLIFVTKVLMLGL